MANNVNSVVVSGNLTRDPELQFTANGSAICRLSIANNRSWKVGDEWKEETSFFNVVCWQELADNISQSAIKGDRLVVTGRLQQRSWENDEGEKRSVVEIVADDVALSSRFALVSAERTERRGPAQSQGSFGDSPEPF